MQRSVLETASVGCLVEFFARVFFLVPVVQRIQISADEYLSESSLGVLWIAAMLEESGSCKMRELRRVFAYWWPHRSRGAAKSSFTHFKAALLKHHLIVERLDDTDRRCHVVALTPEGRALLATIVADRSDVLRKAFSDTSPDELDEFMRVAEKILPIVRERMRKPIRLR